MCVCVMCLSLVVVVAAAVACCGRTIDGGSYRGSTVTGMTLDQYGLEYPVGRPVQWAAFSSTSTDSCVVVHLIDRGFALRSGGPRSIAL